MKKGIFHSISEVVNLMIFIEFSNQVNYVLRDHVEWKSESEFEEIIEIACFGNFETNPNFCRSQKKILVDQSYEASIQGH